MIGTHSPLPTPDSRRSEPRADHVGSLLRPRRLLDARTAHAAGQIPLEELRVAEDQSILGALELQKRVGLEIFSDGEFRRLSWLSEMAEAVEGFQPESKVWTWHGPGGGDAPSTSHVVGGKLRPRRRLTANETPFLERHAPGPFKMTMPSPSVFMVSSWSPGLTNQFYATPSELLQELSGIVGDEVRALAASGVSYVQLDAPQYSWYVDEQVRARMKADGIDPDQALRDAIAGDNACFAGAQRTGVTLALHVCRGNRAGKWFAEGGYDAIAEQLFNGIGVDRFLLEYDDDRSGGFAPLRFIPRGKTAVLGLVSTKRPRMETVDELRRRIDEAARHKPLEELALSPQCGFASVAAGNPISHDDEQRKLELIVETVRKVWG